MSVQAKTLIRPPVTPMATNMRQVVQLVLPLTQFVNLLPLKRLDKQERQPGEEAPIGLILCAESSREQVELLQMHKDGITVAAYWTELPPKAELSKSLMRLCLKRVSGWLGVGRCWATWVMSDDVTVSKGLGFPVEALADVGHVPAPGVDEVGAARVFYVAATRATQKLVMTASGDSGFGNRLQT